MEVSTALLQPMCALGATQFSIALNLVSNRDLRVYCDYLSAWQDRYFCQALYLEDPVFAAARTLSDAVTWKEISASFPTGNVVDQATDYGLLHGISIPVQIGEDRHLVSVTLDNIADPTKSHRDALVLAARQLVAMLDDRPGAEVSRLQSRIQFLSSHGLTPTEIADIIGKNRAELHMSKTRMPPPCLH